MDSGWLDAAEEAQEAAALRCSSFNLKAWQVQRPGVKGLIDMRVKKQLKDKAAAAARIEKVAEKSIKGTLLSNFVVPIRANYEESEKVPEKLPVDTSIIKKEEMEGREVWVAENGMVFNLCKMTGEPAGLLGRKVNGDFIPI